MHKDRNLENAIGKMQADIDDLYIWLCENKLKLNISETKFMTLMRNRANRNVYELKIKNDAFQRANVFEQQGIMVNDHLSFDDHLKYIVTKIARKIGIMSKSTNLVKIKIYNSIIYFFRQYYFF